MAYNISKDESMQMLLLKSQVALPNIGNKILNTSIIDFAAIRPILNHDTTSVTKATKQVQKDLAMSLLLIIETIRKKNLNYDSQDVKDISFIFRNHIQRAYQLGVAYANGIFNTKGFIENRDINIIKFLTDYYTNVFINNIDKVLHDPESMFNIDRSILDITNDRLEKSNIFNHIAHSISATFQALQVATIVKTIVLYDDNSTYRNETMIGINEEIPTIQFYWASATDEKVCPICMDLTKNTWVLDDWFSIPLIPHGAHPHCKCRIMVKSLIVSSESSSQSLLT